MSMSANPKAPMILGSWRDFVAKSQSFLNQYDLGFEEYERELDFYADLAAAHLLLKQVVRDKKTGKRYEQMMWMQMELAYTNERWHITSVLWSSGGENLDIFDALKQDTLWNRIDP